MGAALYIWQAPECVRDNSRSGVTGDVAGSNGSSSRPDHEGMTSVLPDPAQHAGPRSVQVAHLRGPDATEGAVDQQHTAGGNPKVEKLTDELGFSPFVLHDIALHR